jgi:hypothetical protein
MILTLIGILNFSQLIRRKMLIGSTLNIFMQLIFYVYPSKLKISLCNACPKYTIIYKIKIMVQVNIIYALL